MTLTIFYDGYCPLCVAEMQQLEGLDTKGRLRFEDIQAEDFCACFPDIDPQAADRILHARYSDGRLIYGLDVTYQAWSLVEQKRWLAVLRWPIVRWFADIGYRLFAKHRYRVSYWLTGQARLSGKPCKSCGLDSQSRRQIN